MFATFNTVHGFFEAVLGPQQHDAHVVRKRQRDHIVAANARFDAAWEEVKAYAKKELVLADVTGA